jgi:DNA-binding CsgD family transcriptional regulator
MKHLESRKRNKEIIKLVKSEVRLSEIAEKYNLTYSSIKTICKKNNVNIPPTKFSGWNPKFDKRNNEIINLVNKGVTYEKIAKKYKVSRQRIQQILKAKNISSNKIRAEKYRKEIKEIKDQLKGGACYIDVYKEHNISRLREYGLPKVNSLLEKRNKKIVHAYKKGASARSIIESGVCGINNINSIYHIAREADSKRHPHLVRQQKGYINEDKKILKLILKLRNKNYSYQKIADYLNKKNYKTISNKPFSQQLVLVKYKQSIQLSKSTRT